MILAFRINMKRKTITQSKCLYSVQAYSSIFKYKVIQK